MNCPYARLQPLFEGSHNVEGYCEAGAGVMVAWQGCPDDPEKCSWAINAHEWEKEQDVPRRVQ